MLSTKDHQQAYCWQAYNRKQGHRETISQQVSGTADDDEADSDSTSSRSSSDMNVAGKANGAGGGMHTNEQQSDKEQFATSAASGAFNTAAISKRFSGKRPPGGKVHWSTCNMLHV